MRRLFNVIALALITVTLVPAVAAAAIRPQHAMQAEHAMRARGAMQAQHAMQAEHAMEPQHAMRARGSPSPQGFGVQLADVPAAEVANPRALRYIVDYLSTGTVIHRKILIINDETGTARFTVYPDAAQISQGMFTGAAGQTRSELTTWISVQHPVVSLHAGASATDMITIKVPRGATRGEHYGVIWVQQTAHTQAANGRGLDEVSRVGVRIYLAVGRGGAPPVNFAIGSVSGHLSAAGQPTVLARVTDTGGRAVDLNGTVRLADGPGNMSAGPFPAQQIITLAPGQSGNVTFAPGRDLPNGRWQVTVTLISGLTTHTTRKVVQFSAVAASHPGPGLAFWAAVALGVIVAALILIFARRTLRHRRASA